MTYFITNKTDQPVNVIHDGDGPHIQFLKKCCNTFSTVEEAEKYLCYLQGYASRNPRIKSLKISTFAKGFMTA